MKEGTTIGKPGGKPAHQTDSRSRRRSSVRGLLAFLLASLQAVQPSANATAAVASQQSGSAQATASQKLGPKEQVGQLSPGSFVKLTLHNNEKLKGTLGQVSADSFDLQVRKTGKTESRKIAYDDVKFIMPANKNATRNAFIALGVVAGVVVVILGVVLSRRG